MLPKAGAAYGCDQIRREEWNFLVQETKITGLRRDGIDQIDHPDMVIGTGNVLGRSVFLWPCGMYAVSVLKLLGGKVPEHIPCPLRLAICLCQHILRRVPETDAPHAGGVRADGAGQPCGVDALQRVPCVDLPLGVSVGDFTLEYIQVLLPPHLQLFKLRTGSPLFPQGGQGFLCLVNGAVVIRQCALRHAEIVMKLPFLTGREGNMGMQCTAGLTALKIGVRQIPVLNFHRISLIPIIAAEHIPISAVGIHRSIRAKIDQR